MTLKHAIKVITDKIKANHYQITTFKMLKTGTLIHVLPFSRTVETITDMSQIDYFDVSCDQMIMYGATTIEELAQDFLNFTKNLQADLEAKQNLRQFFEEKILPHKNDPEWNSWESEDFSYYSDMHKCLFGCRPRNWKFGEC